jgi:uncharacterized protein YukE
MSTSEIAQLREKIELEIQAMQNGFTGYAAVAQHDIINHKYEQIGDYQRQLEQHIGVRAAAELVVEAFQLNHDPKDKSAH